MPGRHRPGSALGRRSARTPLVIAAVAVVATGTTLVMQNLADAGGCSSTDGVALSVAADPAIAPALREVANEWIAAEPRQVNGRCLAIDITEATTADVANSLAARAGGVIDVAAPASEAPDPANVPAVWVPDSSYWLTRALAVDRQLFEPNSVSLATSPVVLGVSPEGAAALGTNPVDPSALREPLLAPLANPDAPTLGFALPEPRRDTSGLVGAAWLHAAVVTSDEELPQVVAVYRGLGDAPPDTAALVARYGDGLSVAPISEQALIAYNTSAPATTLTAVPVVDAPALDFPYAVLTRQHQDVQTAAAMFRGAVTAASDVLGRYGFRGPDGTAGSGFPIGRGVTADQAAVLPVGQPAEEISQVLRIWTSARSHARVLSVADITASMRDTMVRASDGVQVPRITVFQQTALLGMQLFTDRTDLGHWVYASGLDGEQDWLEGVPIDTLTEEHTQEIQTALNSIQTVGGDESATFETLLAAYQEMKEGYDPTRSNSLILWTDGASNKEGGLTLEETLAELERQSDVTRPIRVVLLGLGPDAEMEQLNEIARVTGGAAFHVEDPDEIGLIFFKALLA